MIIQKATLIHDMTYIDGMNRIPGETGILVLKQDDIGGRSITLMGNGNIGIGNIQIMDSIPREIYTLKWYRTDEHAFWEMGDKVKGIFQTVLPVIRRDDYLNTLEVLHDLPDSELELSINGGAWEPYLGPINVGPVDRPYGYYRARVKPDSARTESPIAYSLPFKAIAGGFPYILTLTLT